MTKRMLEEVVHDIVWSRQDRIPRVTEHREFEWFDLWRYFDDGEFKTLLRSRAGGAHHNHVQLEEDQSTASFFFVSPNDDWPYVCFLASSIARWEYPRELALVFASDDRVDTDVEGVAMVLQYLTQHVIQMSDVLDDLALVVEGVERIVQEVADDTSLAKPIKQLHLCNIRHIKIQRRWTFQTQLMCTVDEIVSAGTHIGLLGLTNYSDDSRKMKQQLNYLNRLIEAAQTDLEVLPRRIENQFTAVR
jgi:hypothetical protein